MVQNNMEQVKRFDFDLQFFAEPGDGSGTPPADNSGNYVGNTTDQGQANMPPAGGASQQQMVDWNTHQAAIKGMNDAQRKAAEVEKALNGKSIDQILERAAYADSIDSDIPGAIRNALQRDRALAFQLYGELFGGQQQQPQNTSPYGDVTDYDEFGNRVENRTIKQVDEKYDPRLSKLENWQKQQYESAIKSRENAKIDEFVKEYPNSGITKETVWAKAKEIGIPIDTIDAQPWIIDGLISQVMGGVGKAVKTLAGPIGDQKVTTYKQQVLSNASQTATISPGGTIAGTAQGMPQTENQIRQAMRDEAIRLGLIKT